MTWLISNWRVVVLALLLMAAACVLSWRSGWSAHADHINALAATKKTKADAAVKASEQNAAAAGEQGKIIYRTITRDVVKYVQSPNRTVCQFDDDAVRLRQRAIDAANDIPGFDAAPVQGEYRW
ncbi:hypothetical protein [Gibbsiella quercinecans]|uniref:hypothetical protein n=1 Tax=Gibbsiella quercinecans TaxID=929813 RepID=UPI002430B7D4|nr:hypothetical protein [Gibbsiella quercinecans]